MLKNIIKEMHSTFNIINNNFKNYLNFKIFNENLLKNKFLLVNKEFINL